MNCGHDAFDSFPSLPKFFWATWPGWLSPAPGKVFPTAPGGVHHAVSAKNARLVRPRDCRDFAVTCSVLSTIYHATAAEAAGVSPSVSELHLSALACTVGGLNKLVWPSLSWDRLSLPLQFPQYHVFLPRLSLRRETTRGPVVKDTALPKKCKTAASSVAQCRVSSSFRVRSRTSMSSRSAASSRSLNSRCARCKRTLAACRLSAPRCFLSLALRCVSLGIVPFFLKKYPCLFRELRVW
jgi:hypothetical protein